MTGCVKWHVYFSTFVFANESWFFLCRVLSFIFYWFGMVRQKLTIPERWQAVGMHNGGFSHRRVADGRNKKQLSSDQWTRLYVRIVHPKDHVTSQIEHGEDVMSTVDVLWVVALAFWWWRCLITVCVLMWPPSAKLPRSAPAVLNGRCRARLDMSRSSLCVVLRGLPACGRLVTF
jgi:hypothetical protein